jgi:hypothetical protein
LHCDCPYTNLSSLSYRLSSASSFTLCPTMFAWLISHQPAVLCSQNKPATSNQPTNHPSATVRLTAAGPRAPGHLAIDGGLTTPPPPPRRACRTHVGAGGGCMRATCSGVGSPGRRPRRRRAYVVLYAHVRQRQRHLVRVLVRCISPAGLGDDHTSSTVYIRRSICVLKTRAPVLDPPG